MASKAWKDFEKRVQLTISNTLLSTDLNEHSIVRRNARGADFSVIDSDVDVLNVERYSPGIVVECKYRTVNTLWLPEILQEKFQEFKKTSFFSAGITLVITAWMTNLDETYSPYHIFSLANLPKYWDAYILNKLTPKEISSNFYNIHVKARPNLAFYREALEKVEEVYIPKKMDLLVDKESRPKAMVAQPIPNSPLTACIIKV